MSRRLPLRTLLPALAAVALALAAASWLERRAAAPQVAPEDRRPPGRWHRAPTPRVDDDLSADARARLLSLPYQAGSRPAPERSGVVVFDRARAEPGINLYVSGHGPEVYLIDLDGRPLQRWRLPFERAFPDRAPSAETPFFRRARRLPGGDLVAIYQGGGMVRLDRRSRVVWKIAAGFYNDLAVADDGSIWAIAKEATLDPAIAREPILEDFLVRIDSEGRTVERISLLEAFRRGGRFDLLHPMPPAGDIFHTNTVVPLPADGVPPVGGGGLLVSLREVDVVATVDPASGAVTWAQRGPWRAQHDPRPVAPGRLLLFDNRGLGRRSRVLELDPALGTIVWEYTGTPERPLASREAGAAQRLPGGNTLVVESERGRAIEITRDGTIVWELVSPHRAGPGGELVATLFDVVRLPPDAAP